MLLTTWVTPVPLERVEVAHPKEDLEWKLYADLSFAVHSADCVLQRVRVLRNSLWAVYKLKAAITWMAKIIWKRELILGEPPEKQGKR